jgi:hypothetical protein
MRQRASDCEFLTDSFRVTIVWIKVRFPGSDQFDVAPTHVRVRNRVILMGLHGDLHVVLAVVVVVVTHLVAPRSSSVVRLHSAETPARPSESLDLKRGD